MGLMFTNKHSRVCHVKNADTWPNGTLNCQLSSTGEANEVIEVQCYLHVRVVSLMGYFCSCSPGSHVLHLILPFAATLSFVYITLSSFSFANASYTRLYLSKSSVKDGMQSFHPVFVLNLLLSTHWEKSMRYCTKSI